jgi:hypothetical protein
MSRTEIHGLVAIDENQIDTTCERPFLELWVVDEHDSTFRLPRSLKDLGLTRSACHAESRTWAFELDLHDDDWANADHEPLKAFLAEPPLLGKRGMVVVREDWKSVPDWLNTASGGVIDVKRIVERPEGDPDCVTLDEATELITNLNWPPAEALFDSLKSRKSRDE